MTNEAERIEMYEIMLTDGTAEDVCTYINHQELLRLWPRLVAAATSTTGLGASAWCCRVVSLDPRHEQIAPIAFALPEAGQVALAGGGAMLAHDLVDRPTQDVDLFTPSLPRRYSSPQRLRWINGCRCLCRGGGDDSRRRGPHNCWTCAQRVRRCNLPA